MGCARAKEEDEDGISGGRALCRDEERDCGKMNQPAEGEEEIPAGGCYFGRFKGAEKYPKVGTVWPGKEEEVGGARRLGFFVRREKN